MLKRTVFVIAVLASAPAAAQSAPEDPRIGAYRHLLSEANDRVAATLAQAQALKMENEQLKAKLAAPRESADKKERP